MIDQQIQLIGDQASEILLISSEFDTRGSSQWSKLFQKAQMLNIKFHLFLLNSHLDSDLYSHYEEISTKTHGTLQVFQKKKQFFD